MKSIRWLIVVLLVPVICSGCSIFKKKGKYDKEGNYIGTDVPLAEMPLDQFFEPAEADQAVFQDVRFDFDSFAINLNEQSTLSGISDWLKKNTTRHLLVEGHCDERGSNDYNMALGEQRALSIRSFLVDLGAEASRIHTVSYGEEKPLNSGNDEAAWKENRRGHFRLSDGSQQ